MARNILTGMGKVGRPKVTSYGTGRGAKSQMLPSRHALDVLTKGNPAQRSIGNYAKLTPVGAGAPGTYAGIEAINHAEDE